MSSRVGRYGSAIAWSSSSLLRAELGRELHPLVDARGDLLERPALGVPVARRRLGDVVARDLDGLLLGLGWRAGLLSSGLSRHAGPEDRKSTRLNSSH